MASTRYPREALVRVRAHATDAAREALALRRRSTSSAETTLDDATRALEAERAAQATVRSGEHDALAQGELRVADLARLADWGIAAEAAAAEGARRQAVAAGRLDDAQRAEGEARTQVARSRVDEKLAVDARTRWARERETRAADGQDEDALDAWIARRRDGDGA